jgi:L-rhamnonate dehydratase
VALLAQEYNLIFTPHTWTNGMGVIANTHLLAGLSEAPFIEFPFDPPQWSLERRDFMLTQPFAAEGGWLVLDDTPGMGYEVDADRLNHTLVGREL